MTGQAHKQHIRKLETKVKKLRLQRNLLLIPLALLTLPLSLPLTILIAWIKRAKKSKKAGGDLADGAERPRKLSAHSPGKNWTDESSAPVPAFAETASVSEGVLIWCPIATAGLTTQLVQITEVLRNLGIEYKISYHVAPEISHPEMMHWIDPSRIKNPRVVFFMERYVPFETGFFDSFHVYYANLDWLSNASLSPASVYADLVLLPTPYRFDELSKKFPNSRVLLLPWPPASSIEAPRHCKNSAEQKISILYVGNDYDKLSRKSPLEVIEAILACKRADLKFTLKFRSPVPDEVRHKLEKSPNVERLVEMPISQRQMESLYREADLNLIPNCSEGNGLSMLESFAKGVVPAVLDGHPMKNVVTDDTGYFIRCSQIGLKECAPLYQTSSQAILELFSGVSWAGIEKRKSAILAQQSQLAQRQADFEKMITHVLAMNGLITLPVQADHKSMHENSPLNLIAKTPWFKPYVKSTNLIDIFLTTSRRPKFFAETLEALLQAMEASPFDHRLTIFADGLEPDTDAIIAAHRNRLFQVCWTQDRAGLPYAWNNLIDISLNMAARTERMPDYICYIQDDCIIVDPKEYFLRMVTVAEAIEPSQLGFVSGYFTEVHPGFGTVNIDGHPVILSDSIDGKNFMARPKLLYSIGKLTWWFRDGMRRGNPGPDRGSHFDLWQWKESPRSLVSQGRVNAIISDLCVHAAQTAEASTWNNDTTPEAVLDRVSKSKVYNTRS